MIGSLLLTLALGMKSCAAIGCAAIIMTFGDENGFADTQGASDEATAAAYGAVATLLWFGAAGVVLRAPAVSMWLFGSAGVICLAANAQGYEFLFWAVASFVFAAMSWRGAKERAADDSARGDVATDDEAQRALDDMRRAAAGPAADGDRAS